MFEDAFKGQLWAGGRCPNVMAELQRAILDGVLDLRSIEAHRLVCLSHKQPARQRPAADAVHQGIFGVSTYNADPPLWGLTMVGVCIPNSGKACYRPPFAFAELQRHFTVCTLKKTSTVFTTFFLCSHRFFSQVPGMPSKRCCNPPRSQGARTCSGRTQSSPTRAGP